MYGGAGGIVPRAIGSTDEVIMEQDSAYEPKIAEQMSLRSRGSLLNMLARNFKTIEKITLYLAFFIKFAHII